MNEVTHGSWIEAGLAAIANHGVEGVRVEVLAKDLGVTKGGFYRRFRDRAALLDGILQNWSAGGIAAIEQQTSLDGETARDRLRALIRLYSERMNTAGMAIELAIRQWARSDAAAARNGGARSTRLRVSPATRCDRAPASVRSAQSPMRLSRSAP